MQPADPLRQRSFSFNSGWDSLLDGSHGQAVNDLPLEDEINYKSWNSAEEQSRELERRTSRVAPHQGGQSNAGAATEYPGRRVQAGSLSSNGAPPDAGVGSFEGAALAARWALGSSGLARPHGCGC